MRKYKILSLLIPLLSLLFVPAGKAGLITYNNHTLDTDTKIVSGEALEWLRWDETIGMSIQQASSDLLSGHINGVDYGDGWRIATNEDMAALFQSFFPQIEWDNDETTWQSIGIDYVEGDDVTSSIITQFLALFGYTYTDELTTGNPIDYRYFSTVLFGEDADNDGNINTAAVLDDYYRWVQGDIYKPYNGEIRIRDESHGVEEWGSIYGVAFVRDVVVDVPEVSTFYLMFISMFGLILLRRRSY
jgi:hypothetical protein